MAKTTTVTTSYTSDIVVNGTAIPADKIYANGTQVRRCIVNGKDVIHKFTRTVVTASSNLTFTFTVHFTVKISRLEFYTEYRFSSPITVAVTITDNGSSGFTSVDANTKITFYCLAGEEGSYPNKYYYQSLLNQQLPIGQATDLKFSNFNDKPICKEDPGLPQDAHYTLDMDITDPDGVSTTLSIGDDYYLGPSYNWGNTQQRTINKVLSDNTVQEY